MSGIIKGVDISTLTENEKLGARYYDFNGALADPITVLKSCGISSCRLRLWVDPYDEFGNSYGAGVCDLPTVLGLAKRVKNAGMSFMLDYHYSDFWTDPAKQTKPKSWSLFPLTKLADTVYDYTQKTLQSFIDQGTEPDFIQVGNEITNGMLWDEGKLFYNEQTGAKSNFSSLIALLKGGVSAVRGKTNASIIFHLEKSNDFAMYKEWFFNVLSGGADCDSIGISYYPYWHGTLDEMRQNAEKCSQLFSKNVIVTETAYAFTRELYPTCHHTDGFNKLVVGKDFEGDLPFPTTEDGQSDFIAALCDTVKEFSGGKQSGIYWWEPCWTPVKGSTWASKTAREYIGETHKSGGNEWANQALFDYEGKPLKALKTFGNS